MIVSGSQSIYPASETRSFGSEEYAHTQLSAKTEFALNGHCFGENSYGKEKRPAIDTNDLLKYIRGNDD